MTPADLSSLVTAFFVQYLAAERNVSPHTMAAYRDALKLLLRFVAAHGGRQVADLSMEDLAPPVILEFLADLEATRGNSIRTRDARLAAIQSFFRYVMKREPALSARCQRVLAIPDKRAVRPVLGYLTEVEIQAILQQVDRMRPDGERDYLLLALLYDTGARVQELLDVRPSDFRFVPPAFVRVRGKGRRERLCPLLPQTARVVSAYVAACGRALDDAHPLLRNRRGDTLTRHGARYLLKKYVQRAEASTPSIKRPGISPHTWRHTKAMHLLQAGVPLVTIRDFLGHADVKSIEIYVQIDLAMKRKALMATNTPCGARRRARLPPDLITWLEAL
ncbi:MAG TPA: tyrosine-type recombinase/integrase [Gemmatimonadota bacterium]|nr:tyrosine-type recombinase/integrase [Gemmatimonadota bacterium]